MNLKFITFNHLKILANNLKNYLNKYNETIKSQKINNITASTAITTLEGYNITIPTVEIQDYSDVENREYSQLNSVVDRVYPKINAVDITTIPDINTIDTTDVPDFKTTGIAFSTDPSYKKEIDFRNISIENVYKVKDINLRYEVSKKVGVVIAKSYRDNGWKTVYSKYLIINGELAYSNKVTLNQEYSNAKTLGEYLLPPDADEPYQVRWCFLNHNTTLNYW